MSELKTCVEEALNCTMEQSPYIDYEFYYIKLLGLGLNLHGDLTYEGNFVYKGNILPLSRYEYQLAIDYIPKFRPSQL